MCRLLRKIVIKNYHVFKKIKNQLRLSIERKKFLKSIKKTNKQIVVFDIDNTIADTWPEFIFSDNCKEVWKKVRVFDGVKKIVDEYFLHGYKIFFLTARPFEVKNLTKKWLNSNGLPSNNLFMTIEAKYKEWFLRDTIKKIIYFDDLTSKTETGNTEFYDDIILFLRNKKNITYYDYFYILEHQWMVI